MDYKGSEEYILKKLENELPRNLYYHDLQHTIDVVESSEHIARHEKISETNILLIKTAALYHDCGFIIQYKDNESASVEIVRDVLPEFGFDDCQIELVSKMIMSTMIPQKPKSIFEKIICDADLDYLGSKDFFMRGIRLFKEWNENGIVLSLKEWYYQELYFLQSHEFFTKFSIENRQKTKMKHLSEIKELLNEI